MRTKKALHSPLLGLPKELLKEIVSHLAPPKEERFDAGSKISLQNANATCRALHAWATEYLFHDMCLVVVINNITPKLVRMMEEAPQYVKHIRAVELKVPPGIRWEIESDETTSFEQETIWRIRNYFNVPQELRPRDIHKHLSHNQLLLARRYHNSLCAPFVLTNWHALLQLTHDSCEYVFSHLKKLEYAGVRCCGREQQPFPSAAAIFLKNHGTGILRSESPGYFSDPAPNLAWASAVLVSSIPNTVKELNVCGANLNDMISWTTVNRLLRIAYESHSLASNPCVLGIPQINLLRIGSSSPADSTNDYRSLNITRLTLSLYGLTGVLGDIDFPRHTSSAGMVRYWRHTLEHLPHLKHIRFESYLQDVDGDPTDNGCLLGLLLNEPHTKLPQLESVNIQYCYLEMPTLIDLIKQQHRLKKLTLFRVILCGDMKLEFKWFEETIRTENPGLRLAIEFLFTWEGEEDDLLVSPNVIRRLIYRSSKA